MIRRLRSPRRTALESYALSPRRASGRRRGRPGRPATGGRPSTRARAWVMSLTFAAVVMKWNGVPRPSQIRWCLLSVFRRSTGDGPVAASPFSRGCGSHPHTRGTSRVRRPRSASRAGCGATARKPSPVASDPAAASRSVRSRTPTPEAEVARRCPGARRTGCLQAQAAGHRLRPRRPLGPGRQQRLDQLPQVVIHDPRPSRHTHPNGQIVTTVTPNQGHSARSCYEI